MAGVYDRFARVAETQGERTAIEIQRAAELESWTYAELRARAEELSAILDGRGIVAGDRCALFAENDAQWCAAYLAMLRLGAVPVPLDTTYTPSQVARLIADCEASLLVVSPRFAGAVAAEDATLPCPTLVLEAARPAACACTATPPPASVTDDRMAVILYTSGTTSDPKGVVLTHANLLAEIDAALEVVTVRSDDAILGVLPLFHALAQLANLLLPLSVGARVVFLESVSSADLMRALDERDISAFCCVPQFFYLIHQRVLEQVHRSGPLRRLAFRGLLGATGFLRERLGINVGPRVFRRVHRALGPRMRLLVSGGSRFDPLIGRDLYRLGFNILQAYGLTETSGAATVLHPGDRHVSSVGQPLPGVELKILPSEHVADGSAVGEVAIRGPIVSPGYFRRDDVNAVTFRDGWLHTGDLGTIDDDGRLTITGRAKDVIVLGSGKNVYPEEIEAHYARSDYIKELCVLGRTLPGKPAAERLHAVVVPDFEVLRRQKIFNSRDWVRFDIENLSAQLPAHKRVLSYDVVSEDLPRTTTRKLKRFEIERRLVGTGAPAATSSGAVEAPEPPDEGWLARPHVAATLDVLRDMATVPAGVSASSNLELDVGLDSMGRVELLAALEGRLGLSLPDELVHDVHTVGDLAEAVGLARRETPVTAGKDFDPWSSLLGEIADDDPAVAPILVDRPLVSALIFVTARLVYVWAWLLLGLRVSGREHLPQKGPFLISPNHQSFLDAFLLASTLPYRVCRDTFYVGASEYFRTPWRARIARLIRVVPVDADTHLVRAMRAGAQGLRRGKILILFPEGERSIDARVKTFKKGAAILSVRIGAPIVPVALDGIADIWPRASRPRLRKLLPFSGARVHVRFAPALDAVSRTDSADDAYTALTERLRGAVEGTLAALRGRQPRSAE